MYGERKTLCLCTNMHTFMHYTMLLPRPGQRTDKEVTPTYICVCMLATL